MVARVPRPGDRPTGSFSVREDKARVTRRGGWIVVNEHGEEVCRHRTGSAAESCRVRPCQQRYAAFVRAAREVTS